jgi:hypothetical protein
VDLLDVTTVVESDTCNVCALLTAINNLDAQATDPTTVVTTDPHLKDAQKICHPETKADCVAKIRPALCD